ncbi:hypothetical protein [Paenibacillus humicola]|uniref:hypothetical protein n=1 Tax=Paenibacillus humicola TaxID=3110540 RepID=UPI00237A12F4|nr:hypothetical protein [Paenibacillus humicola]
MTSNNDQTTEDRQEETRNAELQELAEALFHHGVQALKSQFEECEVSGHVAGHALYGPIFTFELKTPEGNDYAVGFFMNELISTFRNNADPALWLSSFFVDIMNSGESRLLPVPPQNEDEAKALFDGHIVPHCAKAIREEFEPEQVYVDLDFHQEHGPVLEAGFPSIVEGNNVCAMPLHFLLAQHLLNRDPAEPVIQGLYRIRKEHGLE